ncbi:hypothetical protein I6A60_21425 [Frankia sp. AgB1.9]|uniref:hypothetical protein n=1 Tax=unclassified Frankia TaxID=2632575 RepID=UPI001933D533|nr:MULTISPECIES: hypothetical protein [unclassified Frankia]MBL7487970.1 hypothetical protein [Frankia sp. AgW1.1]MBL7550413.1 hypothetical protein [Frankia sp. AgB1.9]MBL7620883.1 hypothetical protein [Frankia sp. AgB1.8]
MLVLQGIDYLVWANVPAHRERLAARLDIHPDVPISLRFVVGAPSTGKAGISPHTAAQVRSLRKTVAWRFSTVTGWQTDQPQTRHEPPRTIPSL